MNSGENNKNNLKELRVDKGLSIEEVAEELKLSTDVIKKLENSQFSELGAFTYVRGYINHYCKILGVDAQVYIDLVPKSEINIPLVNTSHSMGKGIKLKRRSKNIISYALGTSILIAVSVSGWFVMKNYMQSSRSVQDFEVVDTNSLEITPQRSSVFSEEETGSNNDNYHYSSLIPSLDKSNTAQDDKDSLKLEPETTLVDKTDIEILEKEQAVNQQEALIRYSISITALQTSWVKVEDIDGKKLHNDLLPPGTIILQSEKPLHFRIGNENKVKVEINGKAIKLSDFSKKNIADFNWPIEG